MKKLIFGFACVGLSIIACAQETPQVKKVKKTTQTTQNQKAKVVNKLDPICEMSTADHLKETAQYDGKLYGFCSKYCKDEFLKNPKKYVKK